MTRQEIEAFAEKHESFEIAIQNGALLYVKSRRHLHFPPPGDRVLVYDEESGNETIFLTKQIILLNEKTGELASSQ